MVADADPIVARLLHSEEPSIRWRTLLGVLEAPPLDPAVVAAAAAIPGSARVRRLLSERLTDGTLPFHPYSAKWRGAHWVLVALTELGYPAGDDSLVPLREQALDWVLSPEYERRHIGRLRGRELPTLHASIEGNLVWALLRLGLADERFLELHFPCYWHYDILFALTVLAEAGSIDDPRCGEALDALEAKRLPDGGFPAEAKFYRVSAARPGGGSSVVGWGPTSRRLPNEWVSCAALTALRAAGRRDGPRGQSS
ncbi:hypothetical protein [Nocardia neocaledoniensis]|uniref:hypothetical protein n=1 Tax=Nocardia neocaledoniensis TaxID=236511 RepID=UPI0024585DD1|nr:hypothetical protein [Nocardia neocaledoniensis]